MPQKLISLEQFFDISDEIPCAKCKMSGIGCYKDTCPAWINLKSFDDIEIITLFDRLTYMIKTAEGTSLPIKDALFLIKRLRERILG